MKRHEGEKTCAVHRVVTPEDTNTPEDTPDWLLLLQCVCVCVLPVFLSTCFLLVSIPSSALLQLFTMATSCSVLIQTQHILNEHKHTHTHTEVSTAVKKILTNKNPVFQNQSINSAAVLVANSFVLLQKHNWSEEMATGRAGG